MSSYGKHFEELAKAIETLEVFPNIIKEFTSFLKQRYLKKHKAAELVWIDRLCGEYEDNCKHYAKFIKRVVSNEFLAECLNVREEEIADLIKEFKANINAANRRLDNFLCESDRNEVVEKLDGELSKMESSQKKKDKKEKYKFKFSEWLKDKVLEQADEVFAKVVGPLWEMVCSNATMAIQSDYDHDVLKKAVENIHGTIPKMEESLDMNRNALKGIGQVLEVFSRMHEEKNAALLKEMLALHPMQNRIDIACDHVTKLVESLNID
jgi:predicted DNA-binding protein YlxM (UPF0122 family)